MPSDNESNKSSRPNKRKSNHDDTDSLSNISDKSQSKKRRKKSSLLACDNKFSHSLQSNENNTHSNRDSQSNHSGHSQSYSVKSSSSSKIKNVQSLNTQRIEKSFCPLSERAQLKMAMDLSKKEAEKQKVSEFELYKIKKSKKKHKDRDKSKSNKSNSTINNLADSILLTPTKIESNKNKEKAHKSKIKTEMKKAKKDREKEVKEKIPKKPHAKKISDSSASDNDQYRENLVINTNLLSPLSINTGNNKTPTKQKKRAPQKDHINPAQSTPVKVTKKESKPSTPMPLSPCSFNSGASSPCLTNSLNTSSLSTLSQSARRQRKPNLKKTNQHGETKLHVAAIRNKFEEAKKLIEAGIEIDAKDYAGWTALHEACCHDSSEIAQLLLDAGADVNARSESNDTPLHDAASNYSEKLIRILIQYGADPYLINDNKKNCFDMCLGDRREKFKIFVDHLLQKYKTVRDIRIARLNNKLSSSGKDEVIFTPNLKNNSINKSPGFDQHNLFENDNSEENSPKSDSVNRQKSKSSESVEPPSLQGKNNNILSNGQHNGLLTIQTTNSHEEDEVSGYSNFQTPALSPISAISEDETCDDRQKNKNIFSSDENEEAVQQPKMDSNDQPQNHSFTPNLQSGCYEDITDSEEEDTKNVTIPKSLAASNTIINETENDNANTALFDLMTQKSPPCTEMHQNEEKILVKMEKVDQEVAQQVDVKKEVRKEKKKKKKDKNKSEINNPPSGPPTQLVKEEFTDTSTIESQSQSQEDESSEPRIKEELTNKLKKKHKKDRKDKEKRKEKKRNKSLKDASSMGQSSIFGELSSEQSTYVSAKKERKEKEREEKKKKRRERRDDSSSNFVEVAEGNLNSEILEDKKLRFWGGLKIYYITINRCRNNFNFVNPSSAKANLFTDSETFDGKSPIKPDSNNSILKSPIITKQRNISEDSISNKNSDQPLTPAKKGVQFYHRETRMYAPDENITEISKSDVKTEIKFLSNKAASLISPKHVSPLAQKMVSPKDRNVIETGNSLPRAHSFTQNSSSDQNLSKSFDEIKEILPKSILVNRSTSDNTSKTNYSPTNTRVKDKHTLLKNKKSCSGSNSSQNPAARMSSFSEFNLTDNFTSDPFSETGNDPFGEINMTAFEEGNFKNIEIGDIEGVFGGPTAASDSNNVSEELIKQEIEIKPASPIDPLLKPGGISRIKEAREIIERDELETPSRYEPIGPVIIEPKSGAALINDNYDANTIEIERYEEGFYRQLSESRRQLIRSDEKREPMHPKLRGKLARKRMVKRMEDVNLPQNLENKWSQLMKLSAPKANADEINDLVDEEERLLANRSALSKFYRLQSSKPIAPGYYNQYAGVNFSYLLQDDIASKCYIPWVRHPRVLSDRFHLLYDQQENARCEMKLEQALERTRLVLSCEQEIARVFARAHRTKSRQEMPRSATSYLLLRDEHLVNHYTMPDKFELTNGMKNSLNLLEEQRKERERQIEERKQIDEEKSRLIAIKQQARADKEREKEALLEKENAAANSKDNGLPTRRSHAINQAHEVAVAQAAAKDEQEIRETIKQSLKSTTNNLPNPINNVTSFNIPINSLTNDNVFAHLYHCSHSTIEMYNINVEDSFMKQKETLIKRQLLAADCLYQMQRYDWLIKLQDEASYRRGELNGSVQNQRYDC